VVVRSLVTLPVGVRERLLRQILRPGPRVHREELAVDGSSRRMVRERSAEGPRKITPWLNKQGAQTTRAGRLLVSSSHSRRAMVGSRVQTRVRVDERFTEPSRTHHGCGGEYRMLRTPLRRAAAVIRIARHRPRGSRRDMADFFTKRTRSTGNSFCSSTPRGRCTASPRGRTQPSRSS